MSVLLEAKELLSGCLFIPVEKIDDEATIQSIKEMDSLSFASVVMELEERAGRTIDVMELLELKTVRDVATLLERYR
ncbi:acyl carrier protein [Lysobacter cavernae]|uniref:Acyl carrier protein n=1 Tax=Lysobacter cavernae TaxID=1685901 RepID=A0ABV7RLG6_9GAMM